MFVRDPILTKEGMCEVFNDDCVHIQSMQNVQDLRLQAEAPWGSPWRRLESRVPTLHRIRFCRKTYRPSPTKDVTKKDPPLVRGPLIGGIL
jgi:hypothetical protein